MYLYFKILVVFIKFLKGSLVICIKGLKSSCQQNISKKQQICAHVFMFEDINHSFIYKSREIEITLKLHSWALLNSDIVINK